MDNPQENLPKTGDQPGQSPFAPKKLGPKQKILVCALLAQGFTPVIVAEDLKEHFDIDIAPGTIYKCYQNSRKWKPFIQKLKEKYYSDVLKHPLADKTNRLNYILKGLQAVIRDKSTANSMGTLSSLIKEARAEIEGDSLTTPVVHQKILIISNNGQSEQANSFIGKLKDRVSEIPS